MALHILNNVFCHDLSLETSERVFQRFAFLQPNFCHSRHPKPAKRACFELTLFLRRSVELSASSCQLMHDRQAGFFVDFRFADTALYNHAKVSSVLGWNRTLYFSVLIHVSVPFLVTTGDSSSVETAEAQHPA